MGKLVIRARAVLTMDASWRYLEPGYVLVDGDRIEDVGEGPGPSGFEVVDLGRRLVMPGLVNAHTHTPMVLLRGLAEGYSLLTLEGWFNGVRLWEKAMLPEMLDAAVEVSCCEMIRTGTTTFADQYFWMDHVVPAARKSGLRAVLAYGIVELGEDEARRKALEEAEAFLDGLRGDPLLTAWLGPHAFFVDNTMAAVKAELALADRYGAGLHFHFSTSGEEDRCCLEAFGRRAVDQMRLAGILDRPCLAAHALTVPAEDLPTLAEAEGFAAVAVASAGMRAGAGVAPVRAMRDLGVRTAIGSDNVVANNSYDLFGEMGVLGKAASLREGKPSALSAREIVSMATVEGARALRLGDVAGSLERGKGADLVALDLDDIGWAPDGGLDPYTALVYSVGGLSTRDSMVAGRWLMRDGRLLSLDYPSARARLADGLAELKRRKSEA